MSRYLFLILFITTIVACQKAKERTIVDEIVDLEYSPVSLQFDYKDTTEVETFQEYFSDIDNDAKFRLANKYINKFGEENLIQYVLTEIDTKNETCTKHITGFDAKADTAQFYSKVVLEEKVESRAYFIEGKEFKVYKTVERDHHTRNCNADIISMDFGFLFGTSTFSSAKISKDSKQTVVQKLIEEIKKDSIFISCI